MKITQSELKLLIKEQFLKIQKIDELERRRDFVQSCLSKIENSKSLTENEEFQLEGFLGGVANIAKGIGNNVVGGVKSFVKNPVNTVKNAAINTAAALVLPKEKETQKFFNTFNYINDMTANTPKENLRHMSTIAKMIQSRLGNIIQTLHQKEQQFKMPLTQF